MIVKRGRRRRGFTLVELLVVVNIIAILMNVALPFYVSSITDSSKKACRANMQTIADAAQAWKTKYVQKNFSGLTISALNADLGSIPACPSGGTYTIAFSGTELNSAGTSVTIPTNGIGVSCSFSGHNGWVPGLMSL